MNRVWEPVTVRAVLFAIVALSVWFEGGVPAEGFISESEFAAHAKGEAGCVTQQCHAKFITERKFSHRPVREGSCDACHRASAYPDAYGVAADKSIVCGICHENLEKKIKDSSFIHGPVKNGDCSSCHDPHGSDRPFFLREAYGA
ncbi:MAG: cytochrome c3 family protein, partial [Nitrospirota bacterium]